MKIDDFYWLYFLNRIRVQGDQLNMAVFFRYLEKSDLSSVHVYMWLTLDISSYILTWYQNNTAMFNWPPCRITVAHVAIKGFNSQFCHLNSHFTGNEIFLSISTEKRFGGGGTYDGVRRVSVLRTGNL